MVHMNGRLLQLERARKERHDTELKVKIWVAEQLAVNIHRIPYLCEPNPKPYQ